MPRAAANVPIPAPSEYFQPAWYPDPPSLAGCTAPGLHSHVPLTCQDVEKWGPLQGEWSKAMGEKGETSVSELSSSNRAGKGALEEEERTGAGLCVLPLEG